MTVYAPQTTDPHAPAWARTGSHLAGAMATLNDAVNAHWPKRDHASDGFIGDLRHVAEGSGSDHNPWLNGVVRAGDFDKDGIDAGWLAEQLRLLGAAGDHRLAGGGYVIWNERITTADFSGWTKYTGGDPHTSHVHVSLTRDPAGYEDRGAWAFLSTARPQPPHPSPAPAPAHAAPGPNEDAAGHLTHPTGHDATGHGDGYRADIGDEGPEVRALQHGLNEYAPVYSHLVEDGRYGDATAAVVEEFAHREAVDPATPPPAGDVEGLRTADGFNVGPRIARALHRDGVNL